MALLNNYKVITVTHHSLNISDLGSFYITPHADESREDAIRRLKSTFGIAEWLYLETCNRVCFIFYADIQIDADFLRKFFQAVNPALHQEIINKIQKFVSHYEGEQAIKHVFELAASMDSLIVGEREIFRQFRKAYNYSVDNGFSGDRLRLLEKATVATAKEVYSKTKIGEKALSVVSLAIQALLKKDVQPDDKILLVGSGETNTLVGKFLVKHQFSNVAIYNRSIDNASELSSMLNAPSYHLRELDECGKFDIIIICTAANQAIIDTSLYQKMIGNDNTQKVIIDLSVPRNVSEEVVDQFDIDYVDIESLRQLSEQNLHFRKLELEKARPIIFKNISEFQTLFQQRQLEKVLSKVPNEIEAIKERALEKVYKQRIEALDDSSQSLVREMMEYMAKKCVSVPMKITREEILEA